jgi:hypothetical protein
VGGNGDVLEPSGILGISKLLLQMLPLPLPKLRRDIEIVPLLLEIRHDPIAGHIVPCKPLQCIKDMVIDAAAMQGAMGLNMEQTKKVFLTLALFVHGYASILVNNSLEYDESLITTHLERVYTGAILAIQEEEKSSKGESK